MSYVEESLLPGLVRTCIYHRAIFFYSPIAAVTEGTHNPVLALAMRLQTRSGMKLPSTYYRVEGQWYYLHLYV